MTSVGAILTTLRMRLAHSKYLTAPTTLRPPPITPVQSERIRLGWQQSTEKKRAPEQGKQATKEERTQSRCRKCVRSPLLDDR